VTIASLIVCPSTLVLAHQSAPSSRAAAAVFVSMIPAEMVLLRGEPAYTTVPGTRRLWVNNTDSDVFRAGQTGPFYSLVAGRWFAAPALAGPWKVATLTLPDDFTRIPSSGGAAASSDRPSGAGARPSSGRRR
jgi:hypothetical protein